MKKTCQQLALFKQRQPPELQKQPSGSVLQKSCSEKVRTIQRKTLIPGYLFGKSSLFGETTDSSTGVVFLQVFSNFLEQAFLRTLANGSLKKLYEKEKKIHRCIPLSFKIFFSKWLFWRTPVNGCIWEMEFVHIFSFVKLPSKGVFYVSIF